MKAPVFPYPHNFGVPPWVHNRDLTEEISVVVGGQGIPVETWDLNDDLKFCDERQEKLLLLIYGEKDLEEFRQWAADEEDTLEYVSVGNVGIATLREFARLYGVAEDSVRVGFREEQMQNKICLTGKYPHTAEEAAEALRPYLEAKAQYEKDLGEYQAFMEKQRLDRNLKSRMKE
jgi:hypothetical protein